MTDTTELSDQLQRDLATHSALPYLFVGSGLPQRYLKLPTWQNLLEVFADAAGEDFAYHFATANSSYPGAASSIARKFHDVWWNSDKYAAQRDEFKSVVTDDLGALKVAVAAYIREHEQLRHGTPGYDDSDLTSEIDLLRSAVVDGVITTNYDSLTDQLFPTFVPYVGQDELMLSDAQFIAETYKIHGSAAAPSSLVLTEKDYDDFRDRGHYLIAKLLTIFAEHPVIFVGYSLTDRYILSILDNIATAVGPKRIAELGRRIYFVEWNADPESVPSIQPTQHMVGTSRLPITRIDTHSFSWLWSALANLDRPFPAGVLRQLRKHVYDLVLHPEPSQTREVVRAVPIESDEAGDFRVVFGVGRFSEKDLEEVSMISARTLTRNDIERDVLGIRKPALDAENALRYGIPDAIRPTSRDHLPVRKYLGECGRVAEDGSVDYSGLPSIIQSLAEKSLEIGRYSQGRFEREVEGHLTTPRQVMNSDYSMYFKLDCLVLLPEDGYEIEELREVLVELFDEEQTNNNRAGLRKVLCKFDRQLAASTSN
ncbi:SIR2 family protein [uncultured Microbacterium sp.]|uniref:SIR2 family protein n=1 Tax=uncultured Microbacterium sp. TaxID=191216 RepID=UPI0028F0A313|nr:SIR2 family protein [uncultured Microbacterium sp.]